MIVDEAHLATRPPGQINQAQHQRYRLVHELAAKPHRHLLLVSATPHSGVEESFRSILGLLKPEFDAPAGTPRAPRSAVPSPDAAANPLDRKARTPYLIQRQRRDLESWLGTDTPFPKREPRELGYPLSAGYKALFDDVLTYCRESIADASGLGQQQRRVRHWAAIALLRCVLSSPAAAVAVLENRKAREMEGESAHESVEEVDRLYRPQVLDSEESGEATDYAPTAPLEDAEIDLTDGEKRRLSRFLSRARDLEGREGDRKLNETAVIVQGLLRDGYHPIVFCRYIATAKYLDCWLSDLLKKSFSNLHVEAVSGELGDEQRRENIHNLAAHDRRVLVATDCLSEGINLQEDFDAVVHYDLPWNPNRLEQREGRVDRFGQPRPVVQTVVIYGADNPVDLVVLEVLIRKAETIRRELGVSVPVPFESEGVVQALVDTVLLRGGRGTQLGMALEDPGVSRLHRGWEHAAEQHREQLAYFAQRAIQPDEVARELEAVDPLLGSPETVRSFVGNALQRLGGALRGTAAGNVFEWVPGDETQGRAREKGLVTFEAISPSGAERLGRTHPRVSALCDTVIGKALSPEGDQRFARCGAVFTANVSRRTAIALLRLRYVLHAERDEFAEEVILAAFRREGGELAWLEPWSSAGGDLLNGAKPAANMHPTEREDHVRWALDMMQGDRWYRSLLDRRVEELQASNARLRALVRGSRLRIDAYEPDILGCYVLVPGGAG
ncbi:MAG: helicase-related protein [Chloroflexota bacterium]